MFTEMNPEELGSTNIVLTRSSDLLDIRKEGLNCPRGEQEHLADGLPCSRRSDSRAREKNSRRKKKRGETKGGKGTPVNIPLQSSFRP